MAPGARNKFGALMFKPEIFRNQLYCFIKSACDIVVTFWPLTVIRRPRKCALCPLVTSLVLCNKNLKFFRKKENFQIRMS